MYHRYQLDIIQNRNSDGLKKSETYHREFFHIKLEMTCFYVTYLQNYYHH